MLKIVQLVFLAGVALAPMPAQAGLFDDEEARARVEQLRRESDARLTKLEAASQGQLELSNQIETLRAEVAKLRGQVEAVTFELEQAQKRQKDFYVDLDNRMRKLETAAAEPPKAAMAGVGAAPAAGAQPGVDLAAETRDYEMALNLFKAAKYKDAAGAFEDFIKKYPQSTLLPNAHYWNGNALYQVREYRKASDVFTKVATNWPGDPKAPDALLGLANSQQEAGNAKAARSTLETIVAKYPSSQAAQLAKDRLQPTRKK